VKASPIIEAKCGAASGVWRMVGGSRVGMVGAGQLDGSTVKVGVP
jgi:hypothetical protein